MKTARGLTLIEVLVVLGIIIVVAALLVPAINMAIYHSDLAACGGNLKGVVAGSLAYAGSHGKTYPVPPTGRVFDSRYLGCVPPGSDLRPVIKGHINVKQLVCPLAPKISLAVEDTGDAGSVLSSYTYWSGFQYMPPDMPPEAGMIKVGNRWTWGGKRFSVIAADFDLVGDGTTGAGSHPDHKDRMTPKSVQKKDGANHSAWEMQDSGPRSRIDFNAAFDDGSVRRYKHVETLDNRMVRVPVDRSSTESQVNVPVN